MIRKYHKHTLQANSRHRVEEPQNNNSHKTPEDKQSTLLPTMIIAKLEKIQKQCIITKHGINTEPHNDSNGTKSSPEIRLLKQTK